MRTSLHPAYTGFACSDFVVAESEPLVEATDRLGLHLDAVLSGPPSSNLEEVREHARDGTPEPLRGTVVLTRPVRRA